MNYIKRRTDGCRSIQSMSFQNAKQSVVKMLYLFFLMLSVALALTVYIDDAVADRTGLQIQPSAMGTTSFAARTSASKFLEPLKSTLIVSPDDPLRPQFCANMGGRTVCPPIVSNGGATGAIPTIESRIRANLPNVRVSFFIQEIANEVIANGGVDTGVGEFVFVNWTTTGVEADVEKGGPFGWTLPAAGQKLDNFSVHGSSNGLLIYDALILNACDSFSSFSVEHDSTVTESGAEIGSFHDSDNSTLDSTGFYNLSYTVRAEDSEGGISDFRFSGKANVTCSGLNSLQ